MNSIIIGIILLILLILSSHYIFVEHFNEQKVFNCKKLRDELKNDNEFFKKYMKNQDGQIPTMTKIYSYDDTGDISDMNFKCYVNDDGGATEGDFSGDYPGGFPGGYEGATEGSFPANYPGGNGMGNGMGNGENRESMLRHNKLKKVYNSIDCCFNKEDTQNCEDINLNDVNENSVIEGNTVFNSKIIKCLSKPGCTINNNYNYPICYQREECYGRDKENCNKFTHCEFDNVNEECRNKEKECYYYEDEQECNNVNGCKYDNRYCREIMCMDHQSEQDCNQDSKCQYLDNEKRCEMFECYNLDSNSCEDDNRCKININDGEKCVNKNCDDYSGSETGCLENTFNKCSQSYITKMVCATDDN